MKSLVFVVVTYTLFASLKFAKIELSNSINDNYLFEDSQVKEPNEVGKKQSNKFIYVQ